MHSYNIYISLSMYMHVGIHKPDTYFAMNTPFSWAIDQDIDRYRNYTYTLKHSTIYTSSKPEKSGPKPEKSEKTDKFIQKPENFANNNTLAHINKVIHKINRTAYYKKHHINTTLGKSRIYNTNNNTKNRVNKHIVDSTTGPQASSTLQQSSNTGTSFLRGMRQLLSYTWCTSPAAQAHTGTVLEPEEPTPASPSTSYTHTSSRILLTHEAESEKLEIGHIIELPEQVLHPLLYVYYIV